VISRVLLVEDEDRIASFITKGLASRGFEVDRVANGRDVDGALDGVDVMVLDLGLPDEDGLDVLTRLRASGRTTRRSGTRSRRITSASRRVPSRRALPTSTCGRIRRPRRHGSVTCGA